MIINFADLCIKFIIVFFLAIGSRPCFGQEYTITVSAGGFDRLETPVSFHFPEKVKPDIYKLEYGEGEAAILQVNNHNEGWFMLHELKAGASRKYTLNVKPVPVNSFAAGVTYALNQNKVSFSSNGRSVLSYFMKMNDPPDTLTDVYERGGYIHPVYSPEGVVLTNHLDTKMHPHHYGIWSAWTHTEFQGRTPDFWNIQDKTGKVVHPDSLEALYKGPIYGGFEAVNYFVDLSAPQPVTALNEMWKLRVYKTGNSYNMFDLAVTQTANADQPLVLPEYRYGGIAIRGNANWDNPDNVSFLTSKGNDRESGNATRARWVCMGGVVAGKKAGIAVLSHPNNYRAPQPVRIHPDIPYFVYAPVELGKMSIEAGTPYVARYRYITYDGPPDPQMFNRLWNDYAYPPGVTVVKHD